MSEAEAIRDFERFGALRAKRYRDDVGTDVYAICFREASVDDRDLKSIRSWKKVLDTVVLDRTMIADTALKYVEGFELLAFLELSKTKISVKGLPALRGLDSLQCVHLDGTAVAEAGIIDTPVLSPIK